MSLADQGSQAVKGDAWSSLPTPSRDGYMLWYMLWYILWYILCLTVFEDHQTAGRICRKMSFGSFVRVAAVLLFQARAEITDAVSQIST